MLQGGRNEEAAQHGVKIAERLVKTLKKGENHRISRPSTANEHFE